MWVNLRFQQSVIWSTKFHASYNFMVDGIVHSSFKKKNYLFSWLHQVLVVALGLLSCGRWAPSCGMHVGSLTRDRTRAPGIGSAESYPLCHQGSPHLHHFEVNISVLFNAFCLEFVLM